MQTATAAKPTGVTARTATSRRDRTQDGNGAAGGPENETEEVMDAHPVRGGSAALTQEGPGLFGMGGVASIMFAGLLANVVLSVVFALAYWLTGWPSLRLALLASTLVLAFLAVSEPPADGYSVYRRNKKLWLGLFLVAALVAALLVGGIL